MKIDALNILLDTNINLNKKFFFISGNEVTLMESVYKNILKKHQETGEFVLSKIETINNFIVQSSLFESKKLFLCKNCKGFNEENFNKIRNQEGVFVFIQENSPKTRLMKNIFSKDKDSYLIDCYELDKNSKIKILNEFIKKNNFKIAQDVYWKIIEKLDNRYGFLENSLDKITKLKQEDITFNNIKKILTIDDSGKEKVFFNLLKKNNEIVKIYRDKIISGSDVNDLFYYCKFFCQLIIDCSDEEEYIKKIPKYLFREKNFLITVFKKYNLKKKRVLLELLFNTEKQLRRSANISLVFGLRFIFNIKKITIS